MIPPADLERIVAQVARSHTRDRERGQATDRGARMAAAGELLAHLTAARSALRELQLDVEHADAWPAADFEADLDALRRLQHTAAIEAGVAEAMPTRGRKTALRLAAMLVSQACAQHGIRPSIEHMRMVTTKAGIALSDDSLKKALAAEVKGSK